MSVTAKRARSAASAAQRPAARPDDSVWVAASAGTGKTKVLTDRVLSLMLHGTAPARILCLTFTKAAAAEMSNRLAQRLARWATEDDETLVRELGDLLDGPPDEEMLGRMRQLFARVLDAPGGMKILTIHSFCQSLLRRFPLEAKIAPHFQVLDERSAAELLQQAREEVLAGIADSDEGAADPGTARLAAAVAEVSVYAQEQSFGELMAELIRERVRLRRLLERHGSVEGLNAEIFKALELAPGETRDDVLARACADEAFDHMGLRLAIEAMAGAGKTDREHGARIAEWLAEPGQRPALFERYLGAFFTDNGQGDVFKALVHKEALAAARGIDAVLAGEAARLAAARDRLNRLRVARATAGLVALGAEILTAYDRHKTARALLDYDDLILSARDLLAGRGAAAWVLFKLDGGLDHILIDEAQDTNPEQWQVIERLAAEFFVGVGAREVARTVFAVGDAKQSIYSFQRADPGAFARMRAHFAARAEEIGQTLRKVDLAHSFRSTAAVLEAVDTVFAQAAAQDGVLFDEQALRHTAVRLGQAGLVELWPPAEPAEAEDPAPWEPPLRRRGGLPARTRLAHLIARKIWRWTRAPAPGGEGLHGTEAWLRSKDRRLAPGDVLVLVRRRNEFVEELVRELKRLKVPVAGVDRMVLRDQLAVMDLVALGRVLLLPEDDLNLATVLKGPLVALSEDQLFTLAYERKGSLWDSLGRQARRDPAFRAAREHLAEFRARADFVPPFELYAEVLTRDWGHGRGREALLARLGPDAGDPIEEFLSLALAYEREHAPSLEGFLHWLEAGAQEVKRDMELGQDEVRVMTVHGAKGLQAPVVILPDTMQLPQAKSGLFWLGEADGQLPLWPLRKGYDGEVVKAARARAQALRDQEYRRLLYVALTRAEDRLIVCGWRTRHAAPEHSWYKLVEGALAGTAEPVRFDFGQEIEGGWAGPGWRMSCAQTADAETEWEGPAPMRAPTPASALPDWAQRPPAPEPAPPRPLAPSRPAAAEPAVRSPLGPDEGRRFKRGLLVHRLLESLPDLAPDQRRAAAARFLASPGHGLTRAERAEIEAVTLAVLEDPAFAPLFGPGSRAEVPIVGLVGSGGPAGPAQVVSGQVDRLLVTEDRVLVVDYTTSRPAPATEAEVAGVYLRQMAAYRAVLARVYPDRRIDCALLWTDGPRLMQLSPAILSQCAP
ncbi:MAG: double-strand break repair helicase AddA [Kiloniellales bacterium]